MGGARGTRVLVLCGRESSQIIYNRWRKIDIDARGIVSATASRADPNLNV